MGHCCFSAKAEAMTSEVAELVTSSCTLPPMPVVATRVMRELMSPETSADSLSKIIETDQALVTRILKIANSAFYGCARKVGSIRLAIVVLGFNTLKNLVIATSTKSLYQKQNATEQALWEHSLGVGISAHVLAMALCPASLEDAFTTGLLHDIGKLILYTRDPDGYPEVVEAQTRGISSHVTEKDKYGFTHADVGSVLAEKWNLPETLESAIGLHHSLDSGRFAKLKPQPKELTALTNLADGVTKQLLTCVAEGAEPPVEGMETAMSTLNASKEQIDGFLSMIKETFESEKGVFDI
jgi:putative nucleotidyltransferase with HDIG domain